jgi:polysaccharide deacetylase family protein (PEP-CTERM system associated)
VQQVNAFTVDLEDWFQGLGITSPPVEQWPTFESRVVPLARNLLGILRTYKVQATFFVLGYVADQNPALIEEIRADGHEIGIHGYSHRFVSRISPAEFAQELERSIEVVRRITGELPWGHRAPFFSIDARTSAWVFDLLQAKGFLYDSSVFPTRNMLYGIPDAPRFPYRLDGHNLMEFPLSTLRLGNINWPIAGGFHLRLLPYAIIRWGVSRLNRQGQPAIMYMHPWELDLGQRFQRLSVRETVVQYYGRRQLEGKLHKLFADFRFCSLRSILEHQYSECLHAAEAGTHETQSELRTSLAG